MSNIPIVSVILPSYNRAGTIKRSIDSVLNQSYRSLELIIIDDNSTDNTEEIIKSIKDIRIRYIKCKENGGANKARNIGIKVAVGKYIAFQDSDDEWLPKKLKVQLEVLENSSSDYGVVYSDFLKINNSNNGIRSFNRDIKSGYIYEDILKGNFIGLPTVIIKKSCFDRIGMFDESLPRLQDWELFIRMSEFYKFKYINETLVNVYVSQNSISLNEEALIEAIQKILKKHSKKFTRYKKIYSTLFYWLGSLLLASGKTAEGRNAFLKSISIYPLNVKTYIGIFVSILGKEKYIKIQKIYRKLKKV